MAPKPQRNVPLRRKVQPPRALSRGLPGPSTTRFCVPICRRWRRQFLLFNLGRAESLIELKDGDVWEVPHRRYLLVALRRTSPADASQAVASPKFLQNMPSSLSGIEPGLASRKITVKNICNKELSKKKSRPIFSVNSVGRLGRQFGLPTPCFRIRPRLLSQRLCFGSSRRRKWTWPPASPATIRLRTSCTT